MKTFTQPLIFLDIDGVLCTQPIWMPDQIAADGYSEFNLGCVEKLNWLIEKTQAKVILTSTRRMTKSVEEFQAIMQRRGFRGEIIAKINEQTTLHSVSRGAEIREWLLQNGPPANFVILDDDARTAEVGQEYVSHWVQTRYHRGFDSESLQSALAIMRVT